MIRYFLAKLDLSKCTITKNAFKFVVDCVIIFDLVDFLDALHLRKLLLLVNITYLFIRFYTAQFAIALIVVAFTEDGDTLAFI